MPVYQYRYSVMRSGVVEAVDITTAAFEIRKLLMSVPESRLHDILRVDPPLDPVDVKKADAA